ncbi:tryptophanyl-tRNA synthetase [Cylindrobasidium torrendii FP15055 ss-10]|uniref:Tryptophan--tRNA ligase, mitochondrial n=1 Tax=Cylindrobasidium torrendii FP15055 ss-10 TaxID=1314674 RepID=A0A0D7BE34_9AGAR|nr:tryptophanyl-tRNA synthetase [Cylindrobasidium torrendii FP15055 ss-10]
MLPRRLPSCASALRKAYSTAPATANKRVILSGIQPTGTPHLGNYFGALTNWVHMQNTAGPEDVMLYAVVGWHALTLPQNPDALRAARNDMLAVLLAIGLDPKKSIIFHQDHNQDHTELSWILSCMTSMGHLLRMTTWKSRFADSKNMQAHASIDEGAMNAGLLTYPVLMAADILTYNATHVPVGDDQTQHLELARDIAERFNKTYGHVFTLPGIIKTSSQRILSLRDPTAKMSKSAPNAASRILLTDTYDQIKAKIRAAVTDSLPGITYDPVGRPGAANLLTILGACTGESPEVAAQRYEGKNFGALKSDLLETLNETLKVPRAEFEKIKADQAYLEGVAKDGARRAREYSSPMLQTVRKAVGLA